MKSADRTIELLTKIVADKQNLVDALVAKGETASMSDSLDSLTQKAGDYIPKTYIFVDEKGNEVSGVLVDQQTIFDATENDVREGKVFAGDTGVKTGEKFIPSYYVSVITKAIPNGQPLVIPLGNFDAFEYTKLQAMICEYNTNLNDSVSAVNVVLNDNVFAVSSTTSISVITKNATDKTVELGIINNTGKPLIIRSFSYKEI